MSKIQRYDGDFPPFARDFQSLERTSFGTEDVGVDNLTDNINSFYLRGWGIIGPSEFPPLQYFNALGFTLSQALAYLHQQGVPEWNSAQEYFEGSVTQKGGDLYIAQTGTDESPNTGNDPEADDGTNWLSSAQVASGITAVDVAGGSNVTIGETKRRYAGFRLTGTLTADIAVIVPNTARHYVFVNETSGNFSVTVRTSGGVGIVVPQGHSKWLWSDGTNVREVVGARETLAVITSSTTYTPTEGAQFALVEVQAGGGGGGGAAGTGSGELAVGGAGGGGAYTSKLIDLSTITSATITVGAGGIAGPAGDNDGGAGGDSSWDDGTNVLSANGGGAGAGGAAASGNIAVDGRPGGNVTSPGDISIEGQGGHAGIRNPNDTIPMSGSGGSSVMGIGGRGRGGSGSGSLPGTDATGYGGGGSGAANGTNKSAEPGGAGTPGIVKVREFF